MKKVDLGHAKIAVHLAGDKGPILALAHGLPLDHSKWKYHIEYFTKSAR